MPNNPVQIVLNDGDYIREAEPGRGGPPTDFFAGKDDDFRVHKQALRREIEILGAALAQAGGAGFARVQLREDALAKSHRPTDAMFQPETFPCVGAGAVGELYYLVGTSKVSHLIESVDKAEETTNWKVGADGKKKAHPSIQKSEVGAIKSIGVLSPLQKRDFDVGTALTWISDPRTGGAYIIELFKAPSEKTARDLWQQLTQSLTALLRTFGSGTEVQLLPSSSPTKFLTMRLGKSDSPPLLMGVSTDKKTKLPVTKLDLDQERHQRVLSELAAHPLIRRISLPLRLELMEVSGEDAQAVANITARIPEARYPKVAVIDSGIATPLADWVIGRHDFLGPTDVDEQHGTFIGGLLVDAQNFNGPEIGREPNGCDIIDIPLFPKGDSFDDVFQNGFTDFLEEVEQAVAEAVSDHGVRIFNLSINAVSPVEPDRYSYYAARLDEIALKYDIIFVNSAGNLKPHEMRAPWPAKPMAALKYFASRTEPDTIYKPTESVRTISVGALNPPNMGQHIAGTPTTYTRRGPGLRIGCKPDVAHYGGSQAVGSPPTHGLASILPTGKIVTSAGTSFAAPLVSKTLAMLEARIEGRLPAYALRALMIHNCETPVGLTNKRISDLARQFVGFGMPISSEQMLETDDSSITMVFVSRLPKDVKRPKILRFPFTWPRSLVDPLTSACYGSVRMTLVYDPPMDPAFGAEFVRVNLDARLQQRQPLNRKDGEPSYASQLHQCFLPKTSGQPAYERELINQGLKWWPTKVYDKEFPEDGVGSSSEWRLEVSSLTRSEAQFPATGIPFALVVTISDPQGGRPIFQEIRRTLQAQNVNLTDIRTAARIRPRGTV